MPSNQRETAMPDTCQCYRCIKETGETVEYFGVAMTTLKADTLFIVCALCGNKRCPHATDHRLACTNSNEPGQKGSNYE